MTLKVLGLDLSMCETGLTHTAFGGQSCSHTIKTRDKDGDARLVQIRNAVRELAEGSQFALIEAPTPRSFSSVISGMVHGVVREQLIEMRIPYATLLPASMKKYATGRGTGDKVAMAIAALKRADLEFPNDNECDSWWAWVAANDFKGQPVLDLPQSHRESLKKIKMEWEG